MQYNYQFTIERQNQNQELEEILLEAEFNISPFIPGEYLAPSEFCYQEEAGSAEITDLIYVINGNEKTLWDGCLTERETNSIEEKAYSSWEYVESNKDISDDDLEDDYNSYNQEEFAITAYGRSFL